MPTNRISRYFPESPKDSSCHLPKSDWQPLTKADEKLFDDLQAAYLSGYADSEARYSPSGIRAALCYVSLISGLVGFIVGTLIAGMP